MSYYKYDSYEQRLLEEATSIKNTNNLSDADMLLLTLKVVQYYADMIELKDKNFI